MCRPSSQLVTTHTLSLALALTSMLWLTGCATLPEEPDLNALQGGTSEAESDPQRITLWRARQRDVAALDHWHCEGRAAIIAQNGGGQISFDWTRNAKDQANEQILRIKTPLGQNALQLTINPRGATLVDHEGQVTQGDDGEALLVAALGWSIPIDDLRAWLLGLPASRDDSYTIDTQGRILTMDSRGWKIGYMRYSAINAPSDSTLNTITLPSKLELQRMDMTLRLVIDRWSL
jgi:outer membrane lipoprotein LolB